MKLANASLAKQILKAAHMFSLNVDPRSHQVLHARQIARIHRRVEWREVNTVAVVMPCIKEGGKSSSFTVGGTLAIKELDEETRNNSAENVRCDINQRLADQNKKSEHQDHHR